MKFVAELKEIVMVIRADGGCVVAFGMTNESTRKLLKSLNDDPECKVRFASAPAVLNVDNEAVRP